MGYEKYYIYRKQVSLDSGDTWSDVIPIEEAPSGDSIGSYATIYECEGRPVPPMYTWRQVDNEFICEGAIKYYKQYKRVSTDGGTTWQDVSPAVTRPGDIKHYGSAECLGISATTSDYLTFYAVDDCTFHCTSAWSYSIDDGEWIGDTGGIAPTVSVQSGHTIRLRVPSWEIGGYSLQLDSETSGRYIAYGNAFSASIDINGVDWDNIEVGYPRCIFSSNSSRSGLTDASMLLLPAKKLKGSAYEDMFYGCINMVLPPELPATTLAEKCYSRMFYECLSLIEVPELPATTLKSQCYSTMFEHCISLTTVPSNLLPATTLDGNCYSGMFRRCTGLTEAPDLPATTLAIGCYTSMFEECSSLMAAPDLPASTLAYGCYLLMFSGCISLATAPAILPATALTEECYSQMFGGCASLTVAPDLPASTLVNDCYYKMFYGCNNLTSLKCLATSVPTPSFYHPSPFYHWMKEVYTDEGVLYKKAGMDFSINGESQVPGNWQQINV